jgi:hypothetical protein
MSRVSVDKGVYHAVQAERVLSPSPGPETILAGSQLTGEVPPVVIIGIV